MFVIINFKELMEFVKEYKLVKIINIGMELHVFVELVISINLEDVFKLLILDQDVLIIVSLME